MKRHLFGVLVLECLVGLHGTIQLQLLQHYWSGHKQIPVILNGLPCNENIRFQGKPFNITVIQVYAPTSNAEEAEVEWFCEDL